MSARLVDAGLVAGIKYAVISGPKERGSYLRKARRAVGWSRLIISGISERPAIVHLRDFGEQAVHGPCASDRGIDAPARRPQGGLAPPKLREAYTARGHPRRIVPIRALHEAITPPASPNRPVLPQLPTFRRAPSSSRRLRRRFARPETVMTGKNLKNCARIAGSAGRHMRSAITRAPRRWAIRAPTTTASRSSPIINTWSDINACHAHFRQRAEEVKRGVLQAGGFPLEMPAIALAEVFQKPTTMLYRNLLAMETEELLRSYPVDGAVLMGGCDKTTPGAADGRASA